LREKNGCNTGTHCKCEGNSESDVRDYREEQGNEYTLFDQVTGAVRTTIIEVLAQQAACATDKAERKTTSKKREKKRIDAA
jgi:hypothetical protein